MTHWKKRLQSGIALVAFSAIFIILLVLGVYIVSYAIIALALVGIITFVVAQLNHWIGSKKSDVYTDNDGKQHRIIDQQ